MSTNNGSVRTKRHVTADRARAHRPATDRIRHQARSVAKDVREMGGIARDAAQEKLGQWRDDKASECYEQGRRAVHDVVCAGRQFVRERPLKSVLIAAGVGLVAAGGGWLLRRMWMRR